MLHFVFLTERLKCVPLLMRYASLAFRFNKKRGNVTLLFLYIHLFMNVFISFHHYSLFLFKVNRVNKQYDMSRRTP